MDDEVVCSASSKLTKNEKVVNGNNLLKKKSHTFTSSVGPSSEVLKMPVPDSSPVSDNLMVNQLARPQSGGDVLMNGIDSFGIPTPRHHRRRSSQSNISIQETPDVTDSVPTRIGKTKSLFDTSITSIPDAVSLASECPSGNGHKKKHPPVSCCAIFCALFKPKYFFSRYTILDLSLNLGSIGLYVFDFVTDWLNAFYYYFREEGSDNLFYFWLTVIFIAVPSVVMHAFSIWWEVEDNQHIRRERKKRNLKLKSNFCYHICVTLFHVFQIAPIYRYLRTIYYGLKSRKMDVVGDKVKWRFYDSKAKGELSDVNFIRLMESFLESAPQLVLQILIMIRTALVPTITAISVCVSLFGMSISFVAYQRALRSTLDDKQQLSLPASIVLFLYRSFTNLSRVLALALLLNTNVWAWIGFFLVHWSIMTFAIAVQKTEFCPSRPKEYIYDVVIGFCYNFAYINVHFDSNNKYRMAFYYGLTFLTNIAIAICWFYLRRGGGSLINALFGYSDFMSGLTQETVLSTEVALALVLVVVCCFLLGMFFFLIYYIALHPMSTGTVCCPIDTSNANSSYLNNHLPEDTGRPSAEVLHCGDNYRINRGAPRFRSWHSASLQYAPGDDNSSQKRKRPVSDVVKPSPSMLNEKSPQRYRDTSPVDSETNNNIQFNKATKNNITGYNTMASTSRGHGSLTKEQHAVAKSSPSCTIVDASPRRENVNALKEAERKRLQVTRLIEEKQKRKQQLEHQQALLRLDLEKAQQMASSSVKKSSQQDKDCLLGFEIHDFFDRKQRARHLYAKSRSFSAQTFVLSQPTNTATQHHLSMRNTSLLIPNVVVEKPTVLMEILSPNTPAPALTSNQPCPQEHNFTHPAVPLRKRLYSAEEEKESSRTLVVRNGTFPRCARSGYRLSQQPILLRNPANLKPITENKLLSHAASTREHSASLMDLALSQHRSSTSRTVPRAMSFTISKNEVVESMESSL